MNSLWQAAEFDGLKVLMFASFIIMGWIVTGQLHRVRQLRIGDSRKLNHVAVLVGGAAWFWTDNPANDRLNAFIAAGVLFSILMLACRFPRRRFSRVLLQGYVRMEDWPHPHGHLWVSWMASIVGLVIVELVFGSTEITRMSAIVLGIADALGEPIGSRFGRHRFQVADLLSSTIRHRSWEGSLAVCVGATLSIAWLLPISMGLPLTLVVACLMGVLIAGVEAWSPHGLDNLTIPLVTGPCLALIV
ncbi:MAG: hypothetical protein C0478_06915 [Planctomyces sp.]|jgi:phytol kinase|nr:hypothetical protein [Planctomyces sp.]